MREFAKLTAVPVLILALGACDLLHSKKKTENKVAITTTKSSGAGKLCAANATYSRLKQSAFDEAKRIRERDTESLDALADASVVRMEHPLLESRDDALGLTVCSGRMILELPPGAGAAFDGRQRLAADVTYSAQAAADGSGTVYKIDGGEPIVYRLAGFDPSRSGTRVAAADTTDAVAPEPAPEGVDDPLPPANTLPPEPKRVAIAPEGDVSISAAAEQTARAERMREADRRAEASGEAQRYERKLREERIAATRRDERGERDLEPRTTQAAARPSFNCRYARSRVERLVCGSNDLAARDRAMANVFYRANDRADGPTRRALSASRLRFLAYRDRCGSEACVASAYEDRIAEINDIAGE